MVPLPNPSRNGKPMFQAPGGKSNAIRAEKCVTPPQIIHSIVPTTPIHRNFEMSPTAEILRYNSTIRKTTRAAETPFCPYLPSGTRYVRYCENPIAPDATTSGA